MPQIIIAAIGAAMQILDWVAKVRKNNAITSGWTAEERAAVDAKWDELDNSPAWQTD